LPPDSPLLPLGRQKTVTLKLRYADFKTLTRAVTIEPTDDDTVVPRVCHRIIARSVFGEKVGQIIGSQVVEFQRE